MHVLFDSVDLDQIPASATAVAGYVGGAWPTFQALQARFPNARHVSIAVNAGEDAEVLDIETGDANPSEAPAWARRQLGRGATRPCLYASLSVMPSVVAAMAGAGIHRTVYRLWVAHFTDEPHIPVGFGACQWTCNSMGRNLDESLTLPGFFNAKP